MKVARARTQAKIGGLATPDSSNTNNRNNSHPTEESLDCETIVATTTEEDEPEALDDHDSGATTAEDEPGALNDDPPGATTAEDEPGALNDGPGATMVEDDLNRGPSNDDDGMIVVDAYLPERRHRKPMLIPDEDVTPYVEHRDKTPTVVLCVGLLMIGTVIGLSVGLGIKRSKVSQPTESPVFLSQAPSSSLAPSDSPTILETSIVFSLVAEQVKTEFGIASYQRIQDDKQSPQSKAARWIGEEDTWFTFPIDDEEERRHFRQRYALATFFYSTGGEESWIEDAKFLSDLHECEWIGAEKNVTFNDFNYTNYRQTYCDISTYVTGLYFMENNLTGSIPEEIWGIEYLHFLYLWNNFIGGPIPHGLYNLNELVIVSVIFNQFTGTISTLIGKLGNLESWEMTYSNIAGTLPSEIGQLTQLKEFVVWNSRLTGTLPIEYSSLSNIDYFQVSGNRLTGTLPSWVSDRPFMTRLSVDNNSFTGTIPNGIYPAIQSVSFHENMLIGTIPTSLFHGNLESLSVGQNSLTGSLPNDLSAAKNLRSLSIYNNALTGSLPSSLGQLTRLEKFTALYNQLTGPLVDLGNCTLLSRFLVNGNDLTGTIPESYSSLPLTWFAVGDTQLIGNLTSMCNNAEFQTQTNYFANCPPDVICPCCNACWNGTDYVDSDGNVYVGKLY